MPLPPLTHHEIIGLIEPFTRRGRRVDLDASNRLERRLLFRPIEHAAAAPAAPAMREDLQLANPYGTTFVLTRTLTLACGLQATLEAEGRQPGELLALIEAVAPQSQFRADSGFVVALSQRVGSADRAPDAAPAAAAPVLTQGVARAGGLTLTLRMPTVRRYPADIELTAVAGDTIDVPEDLIAVLGWDWTRLSPAKDGWKSRLRLRGKEPAKSRHAEDKLVLAARHLARVLAEPPRRFHERFAGARWGVACRRAIPLLTGLGMIAAAIALPVNAIAEGSVLRLIIMHSPPLLLALAFCLQEMPRIEIPPLPRPSAAPAWRRGPAPDAGARSPPDAGHGAMPSGAATAADPRGAR